VFKREHSSVDCTEAEEGGHYSADKIGLVIKIVGLCDVQYGPN